MEIEASREEASEGRNVRELAVRQKASIIQATPSMWRTILSSGELPTTLRLALCGGEAMPATLATQLMKCSARDVWNMYGPTETTIWSTAHRLTDSEYEANPPIGRPLANTRVYVLDDDLKRVPAGDAGDLFIGGEGLARGYFGRPDLTAERFVPDSFGKTNGGLLYRTGDVVRWNANGELEFLGRADDQVKVRGHRIELAEVESEVRRVPGVADAAVIASADGTGENRLLAYVVAGAGAALLTSEIRSVLQLRLPEYMIPSGFFELRKLPLTPNGKTDRQALALLSDITEPQLRAPYVAPTTETERRLSTIWADVLGVEAVGVDDDFFDLGGHSLLAVQIILRIEEATEKSLTLLQLLENSRLGALATLLDTLTPEQQGREVYELEP